MKKTVLRILMYLLIVVILVFIVFPFFYMISTSLKPSDEIYRRPPTLLPINADPSSYTTLLFGQSESAFDFKLGFVNTFKVAIVSTILSLMVSASGAYGISRFRFKGRKVISQTILTTQVLPGVVLLIPIYLLFADYGLLNSHFGLSLAHVTFVVPFCTWMLKGFFDSVPRSVDEQSLIDGCHWWSAFLRVVLPIVRPGLAATGIFSFILSWNEFLYASVFLNRYQKWTLSVGLTSFRGQYLIQWNELMACSVLISVPIFLVYIYLQKYMVTGMTAGAVKQ